MKNKGYVSPRILAKMGPKKEALKKSRSQSFTLRRRSETFASLLRGPDRGPCLRRPSGSLAGAFKQTYKGPVSKRNEGLPMEAWTGTMASERNMGPTTRIITRMLGGLGAGQATS